MVFDLMGLPIEVVEPRWQSCIVAAPGPSLDEEALKDTGYPLLAVGDAYRVLPWADAMYACDNRWWLEQYDGSFKSEIWSGHEVQGNDKTEAYEKWGMRLVEGRHGNTFSLDPSFIHYGSNSGFQAINLAIHFGCTYIILAGYNMGGPNKCRDGINGSNGSYGGFIPNFVNAAKHLPGYIRIVNTTPNSALECFEKMDLQDALHREPETEMGNAEILL